MTKLLTAPVESVGQVYVLDSQSGAICKVNGGLLCEGMASSNEYFHVAKTLAADSDSDTSGSRRLREKYGITIGGVLCATRPFDISLYAYACTLNTYHCRSVRQKAKDIAGAAWKITGDGPDSARMEVVAYFDRLFSGMSFSEGIQNIQTDYEATGNGYLEVIPDRAGKTPAEGAHVPSPEMWIRLDDLGFIQQKNGDYRHFRRYGVNPDKYSELPPTDPLSKGNDVSSVWHFTQYFPWSPYYGIPSIMPAWNRMALAVLETEYNLAFFNNNAIPDYAVILEGNWADGTEAKIQEYFKRHLKGQSHKTMAIKTPDGGKITFEQLTSDNAKEGAFRLLRIDCRDEVLHAHGMPPQKIGIVQPGRLGNGDDGQNQHYKDSIVTPGREKVLTPLNRILQDRFPGSSFRIEFEPYNTDDFAANANVDQIYLKNQVVTPGQVQAKRFPELPFRPGSDQVLPYSGGGAAAGSAEGGALGDLQQMVAKAIEEARAV